MLASLRYYSNSCWDGFVSVSMTFQNRLSSCGNTLSIIAVESYCVFTKIVPNAMRWFYYTRFGEGILHFSLKSGIDKCAHIYFHNSKNPPSGKAILFLHGDHSHPYTLLPLIAIAERRRDVCVFSLQMPFDVTHSPSSQDLVHQAVNKIEEIMSNHGGLNNLIMAGHSKGGIQSAYEYFVMGDRRITAAISIAGRVQCLDGDRSCDAALRPIINQIQHVIQLRTDLPIYQIVPEKDWNAPIEAMAIRRHSNCTIVSGAMHLNVLYKEQTHRAFAQYLGQILT